MDRGGGRLAASCSRFTTPTASAPIGSGGSSGSSGTRARLLPEPLQTGHGSKSLWRRVSAMMASLWVRGREWFWRTGLTDGSPPGPAGRSEGGLVSRQQAPQVTLGGVQAVQGLLGLAPYLGRFSRLGGSAPVAVRVVTDVLEVGIGHGTVDRGAQPFGFAGGLVQDAGSVVGLGLADLGHAGDPLWLAGGDRCGGLVGAAVAGSLRGSAHQMGSPVLIAR